MNFSLSQPWKQQCLQRAVVQFSREWCLKTRICVGVLIAVGLSLFPNPLTYMHIHIYIHVNICVHFSLCVVCVYHKFTPVSLLPVQYHKIHSVFLCVTLFLWQWEIWLRYLIIFTIWSISQCVTNLSLVTPSPSWMPSSSWSSDSLLRPFFWSMSSSLLLVSDPLSQVTFSRECFPQSA